MNWITVTKDEGQRARLNVAHILGYMAHAEYPGTHTAITLSTGATANVVETVEQIDALIGRSE